LDDLPDENYDASGEVTDDVGMFDMVIENQPCYANKFEGFGNGCAIPTKSSYVSTEFALKHFKLASETENIPTTIPGGRVDGYAFITKSEPEFIVRNGKKLFKSNNIGDRHGTYNSEQTNTDKWVYILNRETGKFKCHKEIAYSLDEDVLYYRGQTKPGVMPIASRVKVWQNLVMRYALTSYYCKN
jgi:hypothetical protein